MPEEKESGLIGSVLGAALKPIGSMVAKNVAGKSAGQLAGGVVRGAISNAKWTIGSTAVMGGIGMLGGIGKHSSEYDALVATVADRLKKIAAEEVEAAYNPFKSSGTISTPDVGGERAAKASWDSLKAAKRGGIGVTKVIKPGESGGLASTIKTGITGILKRFK